VQLPGLSICFVLPPVYLILFCTRCLLDLPCYATLFWIMLNLVPHWAMQNSFYLFVITKLHSLSWINRFLGWYKMSPNLPHDFYRKLTWWRTACPDHNGPLQPSISGIGVDNNVFVLYRCNYISCNDYHHSLVYFFFELIFLVTIHTSRKLTMPNHNNLHFL